MIMNATSTVAAGFLVAGAVNLTIGILAEGRPEISLASLGGALVICAFSYGARIVLYIASAQELGASCAQLFFSSASVCESDEAKNGRDALPGVIETGWSFPLQQRREWIIPFAVFGLRGEAFPGRFILFRCRGLEGDAPAGGIDGQYLDAPGFAGLG